MKKQGLAMLLVVILMFDLLPATALAADDVKVVVGYTDVSAGGYWVDDGYHSGIKTDGASEGSYNVKYDVTTKTLTLKDLTLQAAYVYAENATCGVYIKGDVSLVLEGDNSVGAGVNSGTTTSHAIYVARTSKLTISGTGSLFARGGGAAASCGFYFEDGASLAVEGGARVAAAGQTAGLGNLKTSTVDSLSALTGAVTGAGPSDVTYVKSSRAAGLDLNDESAGTVFYMNVGGGIAVMQYSADTNVTPHRLTLTGSGTITAASGSNGITLPSNAATEVVVDGSSWSVTGAEGKAGIYCYGTLTLSLTDGAVLTTAGGASTGDGTDEHGLAAQNLTINVGKDCTLRAEAGEGADGTGNGFSACGINGFWKTYPVTIVNDGTVEAVSGGFKPQYGIGSVGGVAISGSGTTWAIGAAGISVQKRNFMPTDSEVGISIEGGTLMAVGTSSGLLTDGSYGENNITVADGVKGVAVGKTVNDAIVGSGTVTNSSSGFFEAKLNKTDYTNAGLDLSEVTENTYYSGVGTADCFALWLPGTGDETARLVLKNVSISNEYDNALGLPYRNVELISLGTNSLAGEYGIFVESNYLWEGERTLTLRGGGSLAAEGTLNGVSACGDVILLEGELRAMGAKGALQAWDPTGADTLDINNLVGDTVIIDPTTLTPAHCGEAEAGAGESAENPGGSIRTLFGGSFWSAQTYRAPVEIRGDGDDNPFHNPDTYFLARIYEGAPPFTPPIEIKPELNKTDHTAYIQGYPDKTVRPEGNITREETAMIFYRLLTQASRSYFQSDSSPFTDVENGRWSAKAIATLYKAGLIEGRNNTTFDPEAQITRAEFAVITARFDSAIYSGPDLFPDIAGHWARSEINRAANKGWVVGDSTGRFRPDDYITRAEAVTLINRVLNRAPETAADLLEGMISFPDNADEAVWYYLAVQEAANGHGYIRKADGLHETWTAME